MSELDHTPGRSPAGLPLRIPYLLRGRGVSKRVDQISERNILEKILAKNLANPKTISNSKRKFWPDFSKNEKTHIYMYEEDPNH